MLSGEEDLKDFFGIMNSNNVFTVTNRVFFIALNEYPVRIDRKKTELAQKYKNFELRGDDPNNKIMAIFFAKKKNVLCTLVVPACAENTIYTTTHHFNFYRIEGDGEAVLYEKFILCSAQTACIIGQGDPEKISNLILAHFSGTEDEKYSRKTRLGLEKSTLVGLSVSLFILGCGAAYFLRRNNFVSEYYQGYFDYFMHLRYLNLIESF